MTGVDPASFSTRSTGVFSVPESGTYQLGLTSDGPSRLFVDGDLAVNLWDDAPTDEKRSGSADLVSRAGQTHKLTIEYASQPDAFRRSLRVGCMLKIPADRSRRRPTLAAKSDVAVVFVGLTREWESEGFDRPDMELPGDQVRLIEQVASANPKTIVVLNVGSPVKHALAR